jgi:hypothetical protein
MNERIKHLIHEAGTDVSGKWMSVVHAERFAELIVRDCASVALNTGCGDIEDELLKYFGVEQ